MMPAEGAKQATAGTDYTAAGPLRATLSFAAGDTTKTFTVATTEDTIDEPNETFLVKLTGATGATVTDDEAVGTITDDDDAPTGITLSVNPASVAEDAAAAATVTVTATVTGGTTYAAATAVAVTVGDSADSAVSGTDYAAVNGFSISIPAGAASAEGTFNLDPADDSLAEGAETLTVAGTAGTLDVTDAEVTLTDDDAAPTALTLTVDADTGTEGVQTSLAEDGGAKTVRVTATLTDTATFTKATTVTVAVGAAADSAREGADYAAVADQTITIAAGQSSGTATFTLTPTQDTTWEGAESISLEGAAAGLTVTGAAIALTDDETVPAASLVLTPPTIAEGARATVTAMLSGASSAAVTLTVAAAPGTGAAAADFSLAGTTLTIAAGDTASTGTVTITATDDAVDDAGKQVTVSATASGGNGVAAPADATLTITDDDEAPSLSIDSPSVAEGNSGTAALTFTVTLGAASGRTVTVDYADAGTGTATSGDDYAAVTAGTLTFAAGETSKTIDVTVNGDTTDEANETVVLRLSNPSNATIAAADGTGVITDDDGTPTATLVLTPATINEGGQGNASKVTATLIGATSEALTLTVSAGAGVTPSGNKTLTIAAGETKSTGTVTLTAIDNDVDAADLEVAVSAAASGGNGIGNPASQTLTITDDDTRGVTVNPTALTMRESDDPQTDSVKEHEGAYTVVLTSRPTASVVIDLSAGDSPPVTLDKTRLTFAPADWSKAQTVTVTAVDDAIDNADDKRTASIAHTITAGSGDYASVTVAPVAVTVTDDDAPILSINAPSVAEGDSGTANLDFIVTLSRAGARPVTVICADAGTGTATSITDYDAIPLATLTFEPGETEKTVRVAVRGDTADEEDETVLMRLSKPVNAVFSDGATMLDGIGTITDDDALQSESLIDSTGLTISVDDAEGPEGDWLEFRVHLSQPSPGGVAVKYRTTSGEAWGLRVPRDDGVNWDERDYDTVDGILRFDAGEQEKIVRVWARADDGHYDPGETFFFDIYDPVGAPLANPNNEYPLPLAPEVMGRVGINSADGKLVWASSRMSRAIGTITGEMPDPLEVSISVNRDVVTEGDDYTIVRVTATAPYGARRSIRIPLTCGGGSAEADDFVCPTGLTIHHGEAYGQAGFEIRQDDDTDDETFTIAISEPLTTDAAGTNATFVRGAVASVDLTVLDDDAPEAPDAEPPPNVDPALIANVRSYAEEISNGVEHMERWRRALYALTGGNEGVAPPMTAFEAQSHADKGWSRWVPVAAALQRIEAGGGSPYDGLAVSIADASAQEGTEDLWFEITLNRPAPGPVTFNAESESGTARSPNDYQYLGRREIRFERGQRMHRLPVWVHDDDIDEGSETMTVVLSNLQPAGVAFARDRATGTIKNSDPLPAAWLARFGRTVADQTIDSVGGRLRASREPGLDGTLPRPDGGGHGAGGPYGGAVGGVTVGGGLGAGSPRGSAAAAGLPRGGTSPVAVPSGGNGPIAAAPPGLSAAAGYPAAPLFPPGGFGGPGGSAPPGLSQGGFGPGPAGEDLSQGMALLRQIATGSFTHTREADESGGILASWGRGAMSRFTGRDGGLDLDGGALTMSLGADYARDGWLAGAGLQHSIGFGDWRGESAGAVEAALTSVAPYAAWSPTGHLEFWGAAGLGRGSLSLALEGDGDARERIETGLGWRMAAAGVRGELSGAEAGRRFELAVVADAMWSQTSSDRAAGLVASSSAVDRLRLGLEGSWRVSLAGGGSLAPRFEFGVRRDGGDAETGGGLYASGGLAWTDPGLGVSLDVEGQTLLAHEADGFGEWGLSASVDFDPRPDTERGLAVSLRRDVGARASGGMRELFSPRALPFGGSAAGFSAGASGGWEAEAGYGLPIFDERFTAVPKLSYRFTSGGREYGLGWGLTPAGRGPDLTLGLLATRRESGTAPPEDGFALDVQWRW